MSIILLLLLIISIYIFLYNTCMLLVCKYWGMLVEKFYIWIDAGFSIFKITIKETEYGLGWLPTGGYIKIAGMQKEIDQPMLPHDFDSFPPFSRATVMLSAPFFNLLLGIIFYYLAYSTDSLPAILSCLLLIGLLLFLLVIIKIRYQKKVVSWLAMIINVGVVILVAFAIYCILEYSTPFTTHLTRFVYGDFDIWQWGITSSYFLKLMAFTGILMGTVNLLPLVGFNGFSYINLLYESMTNNAIPERFQATGGLISTIGLLIGCIWIAFNIFS